MNLFPLLRRALATAILCVAAVTASAQESSGDPVSMESITGVLDRIQGETQLDPQLKQRLVDLYTQAQSQVRLRQEWEAKAAEFEAARRAAPDQIAEAEKQLLQGARRPSAEDFRDQSAAELQNRLDEWESAETQLRDELDYLEAEPARRSERRRQIPESRRLARERLAAALTAASAPDASGEVSEIGVARRLAAQAQAHAIEAELRAYDAELTSYDATSRLLTLQSDLASRRLSETDATVFMLRELHAQAQQNEAQESARQARERLLEISNPPPRIQLLAEQLNSEQQRLVAERISAGGMLAKIRRSSDALDTLQARLDTIVKHQELVQAKIQVAQRTAILGQLLQLELEALPNSNQLQRNIRLRTDQIGEVQLEQIELTQQRAELANIDELVHAHLENFASDSPETERAAMEEALRQGYVANRTALDSLISDYDTYLSKLIEINDKERELLERSEEFRLLIGEHILWTRSGTPINRKTLAAILPAFVAMFNYSGLATIPGGFWNDFKSAPLFYVLLTILSVSLIAGRKLFRRKILALGMEAARPSQTDQSLTFWALLHTLVYALSLPLPVLVLSYRATSPYVSIASNADAVCYGAFWGAVGWLAFEAIRVSLMPHGLCLSHLKWGEEECKSARQHLKVFMALGLPLMAILTAYYRYGDAEFLHSVGRFAFLFLMLLLLIISHSMFRPDKAVVLRIFRTFWDNSALRAERFWYAVVMLLPFVLGAAAGIGYFYSAFQIYSKLSVTLMAFYGILIAGGMAVRWSLLERRRLTVEQWKKKFSGKEVENENEPAMDLVRVDIQITRMLRFVFLFSIVGVSFAIWSGVFPALGILENIELWNTSETVSVTEVDSNGVETSVDTVRIVRITLLHVVVGVAIILITMIAVRDLPGFMELAILQRTSLGMGERYAITSITSYMIAVIGFVVALNEIGIGWGRLQWLVAALGLGLGFGLQEIFANFVSGLILLFERPIRVGDIVTVGNVTGRVSRINIRATWITNFNRRELVVPNKEFVTGQVVNWTLTDTILRCDIHAGVAYGSDVRLAKQLMLKCAQECPFAAKDPPPEVYFNAFGDSALNVELRVFSPNTENYLLLQDWMHHAIDDAFREAGIEIAYPQQDIRIRSIDTPLTVEQRAETELESFDSDTRGH